MSRYFLLIVLISLFSGCQTTQKSLAEPNNQVDTGHNSRNSLDWDGIYSGIMPCADCEGIKTDIELNKDLTFRLARKYLGRSNELYLFNGSFSWNEGGSTITLKMDNGSEEHHQYQVGENQLVKLDVNGKRIQSDFADLYMLRKAGMDPGVTDRYWKLIELGGRDLDAAIHMQQEAHLILHSTEHRITGNGGCNQFSGSFKLGEGNRISFSQMISTRMACPDMEVENQLMEVFESADSYSISKDTLSLNRARMAPLARFVAVYFK